jgi:hypothetical protein
MVKLSDVCEFVPYPPKTPLEVLNELQAKKDNKETLTKEESVLYNSLMKEKKSYDALDLKRKERKDELCKSFPNAPKAKFGDYYGYNGEPISLWEWSSLFQKDRHIGTDFIGKFKISTVYMGLDHGIFSDKLQIFETMIFTEDDKKNKFADFQERYATLEEAKEGHKKACELVRNFLKTKNVKHKK